jgi:hypothetical protein
MRPLSNPPIRLGRGTCSCPGALWDSVFPPPPHCEVHDRARLSDKIQAAEIEHVLGQHGSTCVEHQELREWIEGRTEVKA